MIILILMASIVEAIMFYFIPTWLGISICLLQLFGGIYIFVHLLNTKENEDKAFWAVDTAIAAFAASMWIQIITPYMDKLFG